MNNVIVFPGGGTPELGSGVIDLARLQPGAKRIDNHNINSTYLAQVDIGANETTTAYVKDLSARELGNELLTSCLCDMAGAPTPRAFLVGADSGIIPAKKAPRSEDGTLFLFGSEEVNAPSLRRTYNTAMHFVYEALRNKVSKWQGVGLLYSIDSWSANIDRNIGNILIQGDDVWLIDHEACFTGRNWKSRDLIPRKPYDNKIKHWLTNIMDQDRRAEVAKQAESLAQKLASIDLDLAVRRSRANEFISLSDIEALSAFLKARAAHIADLAADALDLKAA